MKKNTKTFYSSLRNYFSKATKGAFCFFLIIISTAFQTPKITSDIEDKVEENGDKLVTLYSDEFSLFSEGIFNDLTYPSGSDTINESVFHFAFQGYMYLKQTQSLNNKQYLTIIDFSNHCNKKRLWVIDLISRKVVFNELVAHGAKTGNEYAKYFSNTHSSRRSSLGFYTTGGSYNGRNNLSLKLNGLEKNFNSNAFSRGIVIHGANYVHEDIVNRSERIGRSFGCPAVSQEINKVLVNTIKGGTCLFIYHPTPAYLENSTIMNANLYLTVDELSI